MMMLKFCLDLSLSFFFVVVVVVVVGVVGVVAATAFLGAIGTFGAGAGGGVVGVGSIGDSVPENAFSMIAFMIASSGLGSLFLVAVVFVFFVDADSSCFNFWFM